MTHDAPSVERELVVPLSPDELWESLTDPDELREWLGEVEWTLDPVGAGTGFRVVERPVPSPACSTALALEGTASWDMRLLRWPAACRVATR